jgi:hypothetical protein
MARNAKFEVMGRLGNAGGRLSRGTVTIDRDTGAMSVRRLRSRRVFLTTLDALADYVVERELMKDAREKRLKRSKSGR